jgi:hypothetical protein
MNGRFCKECGRRKFFQRFCVWCFRNTVSNIHLSVYETINIRDSIKLKTKIKGVAGFISKIWSGWAPTKGALASKLPQGVELSRVVDRGKNEYHEIVKDYRTKEIIHEIHEPLTDHYKK